MKKARKLLSVSMLALFIAGTALTGCGGVSDEQMAELEALRAEVNALDNEVNALKGEKAKLEREVAEKNAKLDQCAADKAQTKKNLEKMNK